MGCKFFETCEKLKMYLTTAPSDGHKQARLKACSEKYKECPYLKEAEQADSEAVIDHD